MMTIIPEFRQSIEIERAAIESANRSQERRVEQFNRVAKERGETLIVTLRNRIDQALEVIHRYTGCDGEHHKHWVIDQAVRALTGSDYEAWVIMHKDGEDGPETYGWDEGVPP